MLEVAGFDWAACPGDHTRLWLHRNHCRFLRPLNPLGIVAAGMLMALSYVGGENAQITVGLPRAATGMLQGLLLFFLLATDFLARYRIRPVGRGYDGGGT